MNRLTCNGQVEICKQEIEEQLKERGEAHPKHLRYVKLAAYEDSGLEPEEIDSLNEICLNTQLGNIKAIKELHEYKGLEKLGRLIKLPCNVNDVVYALDGKGNIHECKVYNITTNVYAKENENSPHWVGFEIKSDIFGKTVFSTREEAEKALKGGDSNDTNDRL
jgi:hypothetical protein